MKNQMLTRGWKSFLPLVPILFRNKSKLNYRGVSAGVCVEIVGTIFVACDKLTTGLQHELFRVNQNLQLAYDCRRSEKMS